MSVSRGRPGRMMNDPRRPQHLVSREQTGPRYTTHLMGHLYNLCPSFRPDRKCKSLLPLAPNKAYLDLWISSRNETVQYVALFVHGEFVEVVIRHPQLAVDVRYVKLARKADVLHILYKHWLSERVLHMCYFLNDYD